MTETLKTAVVVARAAAADLNEKHAAQLAADRDLARVQGELDALEQAAESAASTHANAEADRTLGGADHTRSTAATLRAARAKLDAEQSALRDKIRAGSLVVQKLSERTVAASAQHAEAQTACKRAIDAHLTEQLDSAHAEYAQHFEAMTDAGEKIHALSTLLTERAAPYQGGYVKRINRAVSPHDQGVRLAREAALAEIATLTV